ncbi:MAG: acyltransferase [Pseudomonadota bacterium]
MGTTSNRFDFVRLVLASLVFLYHAVALSALVSGGVLERNLAIVAELAIQGFFIVSGLLVYGSLERSSSFADYAGKRVRRLYPAYATIILIPACMSLILSFGQDGALENILRYLGANLIFLNFLEPNLPGLFEAQRFPEVNGALWTLKIEVLFYLVLPVFAWGLSRLRGMWWIGIGALTLAAFAWIELINLTGSPYADQLARQLPGQMMFFAAGMALWKLRPRLRPHAPLLMMIGAAALCAALLVPSLEALRVLGLAGLIVGVAFSPGPTLNAARWGDISYGVYIVHFPIVQTLIALGVFTLTGLWGGIALSAILVFAASFILWWWVEKPALRQDSHYRQASEERANDERVRNDHTGRHTSRDRDPDTQSTRSPQRL